jgi:site-specific recombinase XerD
MVYGRMRLQDSLWTMSTGSASDFRSWRARQGTPQSTLWRVLSQKQSSTISRMVGLRPRIVIFFFRAAPQAPITPAAVSSSVALYLYKASIQVPKAGSHTLRHTCVQRLIEAEFPLKTIGDYVGHRSPESTRVYSKVAIASLREVAMGDGEEL